MKRSFLLHHNLKNFVLQMRCVVKINKPFINFSKVPVTLLLEKFLSVVLIVSLPLHGNSGAV